MFDLSKIFDFSKKFTLPDALLKSKNYCTRLLKYFVLQHSVIKPKYLRSLLQRVVTRMGLE